ncbi:unnamed protein product [Porites evermanni]|uniref:Uncharacterized protein n=1 Tax=Porites evermanni TaxID=104178 RepID=A0ABN8LRL0_9CNID|nr:unnamed protein product [Porites evermanni]
MKSTVLILLCLAHLFSLLVKETDCIGGSSVMKGKNRKETRLNYRRNICAAARELDCKRELEEDRQQELW